MAGTTGIELLKLWPVLRLNELNFPPGPAYVHTIILDGVWATHLPKDYFFFALSGPVL